MAKKSAFLLPSTCSHLLQFGNRLRLARLRRRLTAKQVAERAGIVPMTLRSLERGGAGVTIGVYLVVMQVLGIEKDLDLLAKADSLGRELQDGRLQRKTKSPSIIQSDANTKSSSPKSSMLHGHTNKVIGDEWIKKGGYISSEVLSDLMNKKSLNGIGLNKKESIQKSKSRPILKFKAKRKF